MSIKFIQINIYKGKYLGVLIDFLKAENPDLISMQEVTTGKLNLSGDQSNLFEVIRDKLGYYGIYNGDSQLKGSPDSTFGNAVLSKFPIINSQIIVLSKFRPLTKEEIESDERIWGQISRHLLDLEINANGINIHAMSWHGAWTAPPSDTDVTLRQARKIADYLKLINDPFILGCDSNAVIQSKTIATINEVATNLLEGSGILQTTHPKVHKIVPRGYLIDFIFTSGHFVLKSLVVPQVTVSDHLPVVAVLELQDKVL